MSLVGPVTYVSPGFPPFASPPFHPDPLLHFRLILPSRLILLTMSSISHLSHLFTPFLSPIPFKFDKSSDRLSRLASAPTELESNTLNLLTDRARSSFQPYYPLHVFRFLTRFRLYRFDILAHLTKWDEFSSREGLVFIYYRFRAPLFRDLETKNRKKMTDYNSDVHQKPFFSVLFHS